MQALGFSCWLLVQVKNGKAHGSWYKLVFRVWGFRAVGNERMEKRMQTTFVLGWGTVWGLLHAGIHSSFLQSPGI